MANDKYMSFDGPVELVQAIFDTAARQEKSTALTLAAVCKAARRWVIPILYETVVLDNPSAVRFESMLTLPSSRELTSHVRHLRATCLPDVDVLSDHCLKIRALTLANYDVHHLLRLNLPSLTHLTVGGFLRHSHFSPSMSAFATITHLSFPNDVPCLPDDMANIMPNLTHFSCCFYLVKASQHRCLEKCLDIVLRAPKLRAAVVYVHNQPGHPAEDPQVVSDVEPVLRDPRVVVATSDDLPGQWHNLSPTDTSVWEFADRKLKAKQSHRNLVARHQ